MKKIFNHLERERHRRSLQRSICSHDCSDCDSFEECKEQAESRSDYNPVSKFEFYSNLALEAISVVTVFIGLIFLCVAYFVG